MSSVLLDYCYVLSSMFSRVVCLNVFIPDHFRILLHISHCHRGSSENELYSRKCDINIKHFSRQFSMSTFADIARTRRKINFLTFPVFADKCDVVGQATSGIAGECCVCVKACSRTCYQKNVIAKCQCGDKYYPLSGTAFGDPQHVWPPCSSNNATQGYQLQPSIHDGPEKQSLGGQLWQPHSVAGGILCAYDVYTGK